MKRIAGLLAVALATYAFVLPAMAAPILFTFEGTGSGNLGSQPFEGVHFTITVLADTSGNALIYSNVLGTAPSPATFAIAGVGSGDFTNPLRVFDNPGPGYPQVGLAEAGIFDSD